MEEQSKEINYNDEDVEKKKSEGSSKFLKRTFSIESNLKKQMLALQEYVSELSNQNELLVQTIEELEDESNNKIGQLEHQLTAAEFQIKELQTENTERYERNAALERDVENLVQFINDSTIYKKWKISGLSLETISSERFTDNSGETQEDNNAPSDAHITELKEQLQARDVLITTLQHDLQQQKEQYLMLHDQFAHRGQLVDSVKGEVNELEFDQQQRCNSLTNRDVALIKLQSRVRQLENERAHFAEQISTASSEADTLRAEIEVLNDTVRMQAIDLANRTENIGILERNLQDNEVLWDSAIESEELNWKLKQANENIVDLEKIIADLQMQINESSIPYEEKLTEQNRTIEALENQLENSNRYEQKLIQPQIMENITEMNSAEIEKERQEDFTKIKEAEILQEKEEDLEEEMSFHRREHLEAEKLKYRDRRVEELELQNSNLIEQLHSKEKSLIECETLLCELKSADQNSKSRFEDFEDETRELVIKLNSTQRDSDQYQHKSLLSEEKLRDLRSEFDGLCAEMKTKDKLIEELTYDNDIHKKKYTETYQELQTQISLMKQLEKNYANVTKALHSFKSNCSGDMSLKDKKIQLLEEELQVCSKRYNDISFELTKMEKEASYNKISENTSSDITFLSAQLESAHEELHRLEMDLTLITEKHESYVKQNTSKENTILQLRTDLESTQREFGHSVAELDEKSAQISNLQNEINKLKGNFITANEKYNTAQDEKLQMDQTIEELSRKNVKIEEELKSFRKKYESCCVDIKTYEQTVEKWREKERHSDTTLRCQKEDIEKLERGITKYKQEVEESRQLASVLSEQLDSEVMIKKQVMQQYEEMQTQFNEYKTKRQTEHTTFQEKVICFEGEISMLRSSNEKYERGVETQQQLMQKSQLQLKEYERKFEENKRRFEKKENEHGSLLKQVDNLEWEIHTINLKKSELESEINQMREKLKRMESLCYDKDQNCSSLKNTILQLEEKMRQQNNEITNQTIDLTKLIDLQSEQTTQITKQSEHILQLERSLVERQESIETLSQHNRQMEKEVERMAQQSDHIFGLEREIRKSQETIERLTSTNRQLNATVKHLEDVLHETSEKCDQVIQLQQDVRVYENRLQELTTKYSHTETSLRETQLMVTEKTEIITRLQVTKSELESTVRETRLSLNEKSEFIARLQKSNAELESSLRETRISFKEKVEVIERFKESTTEIERTLRETRLSFKDKTDVISRLQQTNTELETSLHETRMSFKEKVEVIEKIQASKTEIESNLRETRLSLKEKTDLIARIQQANVDLESSLRENRSSIGEKTELVSRLQQTVAELESSLNTTRSALREKSELVKRFQQTHGDLKSDFDSLHKVYEEFQTECESLRKTNNSLEQERDNLKRVISKHVTEIKSVKQEHNQLVKNMRQDFSDLENLNMNYLSELSGLKEEKLKISEEFYAMKNLFNQLEDEIQREKQIRNKQASDFEYQVTTKSKELESLKVSYEKSRLENQELSAKLKNCTESLERKEMELSEKVRELASKIEELYKHESTARHLHEQLNTVLEDKKDLGYKNLNYQKEEDRLKTELAQIRQQHRSLLKQLSHYEEKTNLVEQSHSHTQQQLDCHVAEVVRLETSFKKAESELRMSNDDRHQKEIENEKLIKESEGKHREIETLKRKITEVTENSTSHKLILSTYEQQLEETRQRASRLAVELEKRGASMSANQTLASELQEKLQASETKLSEVHKKFVTSQTKLKELSTSHDELIRKLDEQKLSNKRLHEELESCLGRTQNSLETSASKDAELRVLKTEHDALKSQCSQYESQIKQVTKQSEKLQTGILQYRESATKFELNESQRSIENEELRMNVEQLETSLREAYEKFSKKSRDNSALKNELNALKHKANTSVSQHDTKTKKLKLELKKTLEKLKRSGSEVSELTGQIGRLKQELHRAADQQRQCNVQLTSLEQSVVTLKTQLTNSREKLKLREEEVEGETSHYKTLCMEKNKLYTELLETRDELERVKNEQLSTLSLQKRESKLKEFIESLEISIRTLREENKTLISDNITLKNSLDKHHADQENDFLDRAKEYQRIIDQLHIEVRELKDSLITERNARSHTIDDLQSRIKMHLDTIQDLNREINRLHEDNERQHSLMERQAKSRKQLHGQLKSQQTDLSALRENLNRSLEEITISEPGSGGRLSYRKIEESEQANQRNNVRFKLDEYESTSYSTEKNEKETDWDEKVGKLSSEVRENSDYWREKYTASTPKK